MADQGVRQLTFADAVLLAAGRATIVSLAAVALAHPLRAVLRSDARMLRRAIAALLIALLLTPTLIVGYAWSDGPLSLVRYPTANELLYSTLLCLKLLPIAAGVLLFAPPPTLTDEARFLRRLTPPGSAMREKRTRWAMSFAARGPMRTAWLAFAAVFLLAFADFELATLLHSAAGRQVSAATWTIKLHQAQQLYMPADVILGRALWPALIELLIVAAGVCLLAAGRRRATGFERDAASRKPRIANTIIALLTMLFAAALMIVIPAYVLFAGVFEALPAVLERFRLADELFASVFFAVGATVFTLAAVYGIVSLRRGRRIVAILAAAPGLLGAAVLAMLLLAAFQLPPLVALYDTPAPLVIGLTLWLMPVALLVRLLFDALSPGPAHHAAALLHPSPDPQQRRAARALQFHLRGRSWLALAAAVFLLAYFELILSVTLAPIQMTPAIVELYNQMHYGQRYILSASIAVAIALPLMLGAIGWLIVTFATRSRAIA